MRRLQRQISGFGHGLLVAVLLLSAFAVAPESMVPEAAGMVVQSIPSYSDADHGRAGHDHGDRTLVHSAGCTSHASCTGFVAVAVRGGGIEFLPAVRPDVDIQRLPPGRVSTPHAKPPIV